MVGRASFLSKIRSCNCRHKRQAPQVNLYRQAGTGKMVAVPRSNLIDPAHVRYELRKLGVPEREITRFIEENSVC